MKWSRLVAFLNGSIFQWSGPLTCLSNMKTHFAFVSVLKNQTLVVKWKWGTFFNLHLWLGLFSNDFEFFY